MALFTPGEPVAPRFGDSPSLLDQMAMAALPGVMALCHRDPKFGMPEADFFAGRAYEVGDAMLKARAQRLNLDSLAQDSLPAGHDKAGL